jgi:hypothetical protein
LQIHLQRHLQRINGHGGGIQLYQAQAPLQQRVSTARFSRPAIRESNIAGSRI